MLQRKTVAEAVARDNGAPLRVVVDGDKVVTPNPPVCDAMTIKLEAAAPVLVAMDVGATAEWYEEHLEFQAALFPDQPPFAFAILCRDDVEIMIDAAARPACCVQTATGTSTSA
jgi:hypothetical protein